MSVWIASDNPGGWSTGLPFSIDKPSPAIMAGGMWGDAWQHWHIYSDGRPETKRVNERPNKPAYRVPSMTEIAAIPWNGLNAISTFSGCGGSALGYKMAGFRVLWANEFIPAAQEVYRLNHPNTLLDVRDIREIKAEQILDAIKLKKGELDLYDGSPPCASFSMSGKREEHWGKVKKYSDTKQRVDDLFDEYVRLLDGLQPKVFVAENVSGLTRGTAKGFFLMILAAMKKCGYNVVCRMLDAQWLGVPQSRQRTIFIGVRNDLAVAPVFPKPFTYFYSVRDALPWIVSVSCLLAGKVPGKKSADEPCPTVTTGDTGSAGRHQVEVNPAIEDFAIGDETDSDGAPAGVDRRKFTIGELKRICAFPDDFILTGSYGQKWERLGRAVPPLMMKAIAAALVDGVFAKLRRAA